MLEETSTCGVDPLRAAPQHRFQLCWPSALHVLLTVALLSLVWSFPILPSQDGPSHLDNASVMRRLASHGWPTLRSYYTVNWHPAPNLMSHAILASLQVMFSPMVALKVFASGYLLLLPMAMRYAARSVAQQTNSSFANSMALLVYPLVPNLAFYKGFYGFCYGVALMLFVIGYWSKNRTRLNTAKTIWLAMMVVVLYLCHPLCFAAAAAAVALLTLTAIGKQDSRLAVIATAIAFAPAMFLTLAFIKHEPGGATEAPFVESLGSLLTLDPLYCLRPQERIVGIFTAMTFAALVSYTALCRLGWFFRSSDPLRRLQWKPEVDGWLLLPIVFALALPLVPNRFAGGGWITLRLTLFPYLLVLPWLCGAATSRLLRWIVPLAATSLTLCLVASQWIGIRAAQPLLTEYLSVAPHLQPDTTLLPISSDDDGHTVSGRPIARHNLHLFLHASGYLTAERGCVDLSNYEARLDYFPVAFKPATLPAMDAVDYVLLWQPRNKAASVVSEIPAKLAADFDLIFTSSNGHAKLFRAKGIAVGAAPPHD